jgi:hypothetical protein
MAPAIRTVEKGIKKFVEEGVLAQNYNEERGIVTPARNLWAR